MDFSPIIPASSLVYGVTGVVLLLLGQILRNGYYKENYEYIPTVGPSGRLTSFIGGLRFVLKAKDILREGYYRYPDAIFKVPTIQKWEVVVNGPQLIDDIRRAGDDELSFHHASSDLWLRRGKNTQLDYTTKSGLRENPYHLKIVQTTLTTHFGPYCAAIHDEIVASMNDLVPTKGTEWTSIPALTTMTDLIARTGNRIFVGLPFCRNQAYLKLAINFSRDLILSAVIINHTPKVLQPLMGRLVSPLKYYQRNGMKHLGEILTHRVEMKKEYGKDWEDKPDDLISWLIDEAEGDMLEPENLVMRILFLNFAAIHTTSITLTNALFDLATYPQYIQELREEAKEAIGNEGWSKAGIAKLHKLDSFIRESMRVSGLAGISLMRKVIHPRGFKFSNGVTLPYGTYVSVAADALHHDENVYTNANTFEGFRFYDMCKSEEDRVKYLFTSPSTEYLPFGMGRHACPGRYETYESRFFAVHEIKSTLAYILLNYDIKLKDQLRPSSQWLAYAIVPDSKGQLMFRKRKEAL
ncbi:cytochrome P450 [Cyathus striatus]|nr:cytochrome P450 [Cyathus striatus]